MLSHIALTGLWAQYKISWELNPDINILIGINGCGKSTLLRILSAALVGDKVEAHSIDEHFPSDYSLHIAGSGTNIEVQRGRVVAYTRGCGCDIVNTFDEVTHEKKAVKGELSPLAAQLNTVIFDTRRSSLNAYRLNATESPEAAVRVSEHLRRWMEVVNSFFAATQKRLVVQGSEVYVRMAGGERLELSRLSAGEKQLLVILTRVLTQDGKPFVLLMDEPEISLDIDWQYRLIEAIRSINPACQLIMATHSPAIFGDGWSDKLFYIEDLFEPMGS